MVALAAVARLGARVDDCGEVRVVTVEAGWLPRGALHMPARPGGPRLPGSHGQGAQRTRQRPADPAMVVAGRRGCRTAARSPRRTPMRRRRSRSCRGKRREPARPGVSPPGHPSAALKRQSLARSLAALAQRRLRPALAGRCRSTSTRPAGLRSRRTSLPRGRWAGSSAVAQGLLAGRPSRPSRADDAAARGSGWRPALSPQPADVPRGAPGRVPRPRRGTRGRCGRRETTAALVGAGVQRAALLTPLTPMLPSARLLVEALRSAGSGAVTSCSADAAYLARLPPADDHPLHAPFPPSPSLPLSPCPSPLAPPLAPPQTRTRGPGSRVAC